ncbi:hypothetical protein NHX12_002581, partial [Muraenolepis orangiensis]
ESQERPERAGSPSRPRLLPRLGGHQQYLHSCHWQEWEEGRGRRRLQSELRQSQDFPQWEIFPLSSRGTTLHSALDQVIQM